MLKRIARWKRISLIVILYELAITLTAAISLALSAFEPNGYASFHPEDLLFMMNPAMPILMLAALFWEFVEVIRYSDLFNVLFYLLLPVGEALLLLLGWRLAALGKRSGSAVIVACGTVHLILDLLCILFIPLIGVFTVLYLVFPILLLYGYTRWQPPLR